jgi:hypothetical protein
VRGLEAAEDQLARNPEPSVGDTLVPIACARSRDGTSVERTVNVVAVVVGSLIIVDAMDAAITPEDAQTRVNLAGQYSNVIMKVLVSCAILI